MEARGSITAEQRQAADRFRSDFDLAALQQLRAAPLERSGGAGAREATTGQIDARKRVHAALAVLGGAASPGGCCLWHVVGEGDSLRDWARRAGWSGRPIDHRTAAGILIGALAALVAHYEARDSRATA